MKKLVLAMVAVAAISFASCGNNAKPAADADSTATDSTEQVDSTDSASDSTSAAAPADSVKNDSVKK